MESQEIDRIFHLTDNLCGYAESCIKKIDFGLTPREFKALSHEAISYFVPLIGGTIHLFPREKIYDTSTNQTIWDSNQTLRFAIGASFVSLDYKSHMDPENSQRSIIAKTLYKYQMGILDDLIDKGDYDYPEAKKLYEHVVGSMCSRNLDHYTFQEKLNGILSPNQLSISDIISSITIGFNSFFLNAPRYEEIMPLMQTLDERVIEGQALTVLQKENYLDLERLRRITEKFYALEDDLRWHEKLSNYISGGTRYNLIDIAYTNGGFDPKKIDNILKVWYFYDIVVVLLNNIVNIDGDLKDGIYNLSLIDMKNGDISSVKGHDPNITLADYERHILRNAEIAKKALKYVSNEDNWRFYKFITLMIPIVMMANWIGKRDSLIELFLQHVS